MNSREEVILTGASGFAGAHMLNNLLCNTDFFVYCPVTYSHGGKELRISSLIDKKFENRFKLFRFDLAQQSLHDLTFLRNCKSIINFASESHVDRSIISPKEFVQNNLNLMVNLLEFSRNSSQIQNFLHISTDEVYGNLDLGTKNYEWERPHFPSNPYSASKSAQESLAISYFKTFQKKLIFFNVTNMFGETQNQEKFIPNTISRIIDGLEISIDTDSLGTIGSRKYIYVGAVASKIQSFLRSATYSNPYPQLLRYHISGNERINNLMVARTIANCLGKPLKYKLAISPRQGYDLNYELDTRYSIPNDETEIDKFELKMQEVVTWTVKNREWLRINY